MKWSSQTQNWQVVVIWKEVDRQTCGTLAPASWLYLRKFNYMPLCCTSSFLSYIYIYIFIYHIFCKLNLWDPLRVVKTLPILVRAKHYQFSPLFLLTIAKSLRGDHPNHSHHYSWILWVNWCFGKYHFHFSHGGLKMQSMFGCDSGDNVRGRI